MQLRGFRFLHTISNGKNHQFSGGSKKIKHVKFPETDITYSIIRTRTCAYHRVENISFSKILRALSSCNHRFEIRPFAL